MILFGIYISKNVLSLRFQNKKERISGFYMENHRIIFRYYFLYHIIL